MVLLPPESIDYDFNIADYQQVRASSSSYLQIISSSYWAARIQSFYFNLFKKIYLLITVVLSLLYVLKKKKSCASTGTFFENYFISHKRFVNDPLN